MPCYAVFCRGRLALVQHPMGSGRSSYKSSGLKTYADFEVMVQQKCYICARSWTYFMVESLELLYYVSPLELYAIQEGGYGELLVLSSHLQIRKVCKPTTSVRRSDCGAFREV